MDQLGISLGEIDAEESAPNGVNGYTWNFFIGGSYYKPFTRTRLLKSSFYELASHFVMH